MRGVVPAGLVAGAVTVTALASVGPGALVPLKAVVVAASDVSVAFVVDFGSAGVVTACVKVPATDNGYEALAAFTQQENEATPTFNSAGLLCSINGDPSSGCGQAVTGGYDYWSYWHGTTGSWAYASTGAFGTVTNGDVEGWRFQDPGTGNPNDPPPRSAPNYTAICGAIVSTTTVASTPSPTPTLSPGPKNTVPTVTVTTAVRPSPPGTPPTTESTGLPPPPVRPPPDQVPRRRRRHRLSPRPAPGPRHRASLRTVIATLRPTMRSHW